MSIAQIRQRGAKNFEAYYQSLCALESTTPVAGILAGAKLTTLKCNASQLRASDWHPLLSALQINKTFHTVAIYKKWEDVYLSQDVRTTGKVRKNAHLQSRLGVCMHKLRGSPASVSVHDIQSRRGWCTRPQCSNHR